MRPLAGAGTLMLNSPTLPDNLGTLASGASVTVPLNVTMTPTVTSAMVVESGTVQDSSGNTYNWSATQTGTTH